MVPCNVLNKYKSRANKKSPMEKCIRKGLLLHAFDDWWSYQRKIVHLLQILLHSGRCRSPQCWYIKRWCRIHLVHHSRTRRCLDFKMVKMMMVMIMLMMIMKKCLCLWRSAYDALISYGALQTIYPWHIWPTSYYNTGNNLSVMTCLRTMNNYEWPCVILWWLND